MARKDAGDRICSLNDIELVIPNGMLRPHTQVCRKRRKRRVVAGGQ